MTPDLSQLEALAQSSDLPSIAYGISQGTKTLRIGATNNGSPDLPYALASVTKPMTATAIMLLVERGLVDLDRPINDYLSVPLEAKRGRAEDASVRRVLDHSSGLHTYFRFYYADEQPQRRPFEEVIERYGKLMSAPGERYCYSNLGYGLLDEVISRVSGVSYAEFMQQEFFGPLGMEHAFIGPPASRRAASSYGPDGVAYPDYDFDHPGGSAAYASVQDLLKFGQFHLGHGPGLLDNPSAMHERSSIIDDVRGYGLGWGVNLNHMGHKLVQHTGSMGGVSTILRLVPELDLVFVGLVNGQTDVLGKLADEALAAIAGRGPSETTRSPDVSPLPEGRYKGVIETYEGMRDLELLIGPHPVAILDGRAAALENCKVEGGRLTAVFDGDINTSDLAGMPHRIHLDLGADMCGAALAMYHYPQGTGGARGKRMGNALPYWTKLEKQ